MCYNQHMAKIDEIKEWLNFLNRLFTIGLVTLLGIVGWLFMNYTTVSNVLIGSALIGILVLTVVLILLSRKIISNIKMMKDLK
ncbi:hypothetical protein M947_11030 [Sulfurimonas hongkongensis]|uniref:Uncharacterized protein n=1 Tax=Sulfurimonas hongkongensis TaxID=1172190 RepID=T0JC39_9BACT|nr:hypothetical protein M947_11030 [Sulfurimonas hongkongensis]